MTTATDPRALRADYEVLKAYDLARFLMPYDMTHGRRQRTLDRMVDKLFDAEAMSIEPTAEELRAAYERLVTRMVRSSARGVSSAVIAALDEMRRELNLGKRPQRLAEAFDGGAVYTTGGSRRRRR